MPVPSQKIVQKALRPAAIKLLIAQTAHKALAEEMEKVDNDLLALGNYVSQYDGSPVTQGKHAWTIEDEAAKPFYEAREAYIEAKYPHIQKGYCPALIAKSEVIDLQKELIQANLAFFPEMTFEALCRNMALFDEALEIITGLALAD